MFKANEPCTYCIFVYLYCHKCIRLPTLLFHVVLTLNAKKMCYGTMYINIYEKTHRRRRFELKWAKKNVHFGLVRWLSLDCYIFSVQWSEWSKEKQIFRPTQFILFYYYFYVFFFFSKTHFILNAKSECISNQNFLLLLSVIVRDMFSL